MDYKFYSPGKVIKTIATILILSTLGCGAAKIESPKTEHLEASLISEVTGIQPGIPFWVGLKLKMEEGWHVNWKNPGDAGLAPSIKWELPEGFTAGEIQWPIPERLLVSEFVLFGYEGTVLLPVEITPPATIENEKFSITASCDWVVCGEVCVPGEAKLSLELLVKQSTNLVDSKWASEFASTRDRLPDAYSVCGVSATATDSIIIIEYLPTVLEFPSFDSMVFFPEEQGIINNAAYQKLTKTGNNYRLEIKRDKLVRNLPKTMYGIIAFKSETFPSWTKGIYTAFVF